MGEVEAAAQAASSGRKEKVSWSATLEGEGVSAEKLHTLCPVGVL